MDNGGHLKDILAKDALCVISSVQVKNVEVNNV